MAIVHLNKAFRLVWDKNNQIILSGEFETSTKTGCLSEFSFEADTQAEIDAKTTELNLVKIVEDAGL
ncbi:hypothetical protein [Flavicella sp.]|uniref:hypothetical protein n=1 Tax=Flavicella sp. TaxID=2957742 RepID=UPI0030181406